MSPLAERWLAALRSSTYKPGSGFLRRPDDRFCCLGVACDVKDPSRWENPDPLAPSRFRNPDGTGVDMYLPDDVRDELGLTQTQMIQLAEHNDLGMGFPALADVAEGYLRGPG